MGGGGSGAWCADWFTVSERVPPSAAMPSRGRQRWHVRPAGRLGFTCPRPPMSPHGFVVPDQAAGLDHPAATAALFRLPGGDRDCGVHPSGVDEVGAERTYCHGGLLGQCPVHLRGASAGGRLGVALRLPPDAVGLDVTASFE